MNNNKLTNDQALKLQSELKNISLDKLREILNWTDNIGYAGEFIVDAWNGLSAYVNNHKRVLICNPDAMKYLANIGISLKAPDDRYTFGMFVDAPGKTKGHAEYIHKNSFGMFSIASYNDIRSK